MAFAPKPERLEARVTSEQKELIERAADLEGRTLTDFLVVSAATAAKKVIQEHEILMLTAQSRSVFLAALQSPPEPNAKLRELARSNRR